MYSIVESKKNFNCSVQHLINHFHENYNVKMHHSLKYIGFCAASVSMLSDRLFRELIVDINAHLKLYI